MGIRSIRWPDERDAVLDHIRRTQSPADADLLAGTYGTLPGFDPRDCLVIEGDTPGEIAAHAMIVTRQLQIGDSTLPTAEIALLGVLDEYAGQRLEITLLDGLHARMTERGDVLGLSFGAPYVYERWLYDYAVGLYLTRYESILDTGAGLQAGQWDSTHSYERRTAARLGVRGPTEVRRFYLDDLPAVRALYAAESAAGHAMIARDEATWLWQIDHLGRMGISGPDDFLVAEADHRLVAYVRVASDARVNVFRGEHSPRVSVIEAAGDHPDGVEALLGEVARIAHALDEPQIGLFVHPDNRLIQHALVRGATLRHFTGAALLRLHDVARALDLLAPTLDRRRYNSPFRARAYRLSVRTEYEQAEIVLGRGDPELIDLEVPTTALLRLFTGWYGIDHLTLGYHERFADLLRVLFPVRDPRLGLADLL